MKTQLNEIKRMQQLAGLLKENNQSTMDEGLKPSIDLKKLSKVLNMIKDEDGEPALENYEKDQLLYAIKNMSTLIKNFNNSKYDDISSEAKEILEDLPSDWHNRLSPQKQKIFQPLYDAITTISSASDEMDSKIAVRGYNEIAAFLNKIK
jgi:hypothetical protein